MRGAGFADDDLEDALAFFADLALRDFGAGLRDEVFFGIGVGFLRE